jgi:hypothetical protein
VHLGFVQSIIARLAGNSAAAKGWCAAIVAAVLVVNADGLVAYRVAVGLIVTAAFGLIDAYYLSLERDYRRVYRDLLRDLRGQGIPSTALFSLAIDRDQERRRRTPETLRALGSPSIWPFYGVLLTGLGFLLALTWGWLPG